jgi:hypothetical protein
MLSGSLSPLSLPASLSPFGKKARAKVGPGALALPLFFFGSLFGGVFGEPFFLAEAFLWQGELVGSPSSSSRSARWRSAARRCSVSSCIVAATSNFSEKRC